MDPMIEKALEIWLGYLYSERDEFESEEQAWEYFIQDFCADYDVEPSWIEENESLIRK